MRAMHCPKSLASGISSCGVRPPTRCQFGICLACGFQDGWSSRHCLVTAQHNIDMERVEFEAAAASASALSSDKRRSRTEERIEHDVAALSQVKQCVFYHGDRFDGGVVPKTFSSFGADAASAWIVPNIRAPTTVLTELDIIDVVCSAMLK